LYVEVAKNEAQQRIWVFYKAIEEMVTAFRLAMQGDFINVTGEYEPAKEN
jgi:hypothetical protein